MSPASAFLNTAQNWCEKQNKTVLVFKSLIWLWVLGPIVETSVLKAWVFRFKILVCWFELKLDISSPLISHKKVENLIPYLKEVGIHLF